MLEGIIKTLLVGLVLSKPAMILPSKLSKPNETEIVEKYNIGENNYIVTKRINKSNKIRPYEYNLLKSYDFEDITHNFTIGKASGWEIMNFNYLAYFINYERSFAGSRAFLKFTNILEQDVLGRGINRIHTDSFFRLVPIANKRGFKSVIPYADKFISNMPLSEYVPWVLHMYKKIGG